MNRTWYFFGFFPRRVFSLREIYVVYYKNDRRQRINKSRTGAADRKGDVITTLYQPYVAAQKVRSHLFYKVQLKNLAALEDIRSSSSFSLQTQQRPIPDDAITGPVFIL